MSPTLSTLAKAILVKKVRFFTFYPPLPVLGRGFLCIVTLGAAPSCLPQRSATVKKPQVTYLVKVNGFTKFQSNNYLDALEYLLQQRRSSCQKVYMTCREYEEGHGCM